MAIIVKTQGQNFKIYSSDIKVWSQHPYEIQKPYHLPFKTYGQSESFKKWIKLQGQGHKDKNYATIRKFLS
jgi:uncharacterized protein involved in tolerance to divalent cations